MAVRRVLLTDDLIAAEELSAESSVTLADTRIPGLYLVIGSRTKSFHVKLHRKRRALGPWPIVSADEARAAAVVTLRELHGIQECIAPTPAPQPAIPSATSVTLSQALEEYIQQRLRVGKLRPRTRDDYRQCLKRYWAAWMDRPLAELTANAFREHFLTIPSPAQADYSLRIIRAVVRFYGVLHDLDMPSPTRKVQALKEMHNVSPRSRLILESQQSLWYEAVQRESATARDLFLFLATSGLRSGEALSLTWDCIDLERGGFIVKETKNGLSHELPVGTQTLALLQRRHAAVGHPSKGRIFGINARNMRFALASVVKRSGIEWSPHDLRRGLVTLAVKMGLTPSVCRRLVNHKEKDVTGAHYTHLSAEDMRPYVQALEDRLMELWMQQKIPH